jgi:hypothetical protein
MKVRPDPSEDAHREPLTTYADEINAVPPHQPKPFVRIVCEYFRITRPKQVEPVHVSPEDFEESRRFEPFIKTLDGVTGGV